MKSKIGIIMVALCVLSYFMYDREDKKKETTKGERIIHGKIIDTANNSPIKDVSVALQGQNPKSLSNAEGEFAILANNEDNLIFRHQNYKTKELPASETQVVKMDLSGTQSTN